MPRARKCVFVGYPPGIKGYKLLDLQSREIFVSRDVVFHELIFPFHHEEVKNMIIYSFIHKKIISNQTL